MLMQAHTLALCTSIPQHRGCSISMASLLPGAWCGRRPRCVSLRFVLRVATSDSVWSQKWRPGQTLSQAEMPYCSLRPRSTTRPRPAYLNATFIRHGEAQHHLQLSQEGERRSESYSVNLVSIRTKNQKQSRTALYKTDCTTMMVGSFS